jgi:DNA gyrase/topoisomerase IV subunit A
MIITRQAKLIRLDVGAIKKTKGRSAQGVRLQKMDEGDMVTSASLVEAAVEAESEDVQT